MDVYKIVFPDCCVV